MTIRAHHLPCPVAHQRRKNGGRSLHHHPLPCGAPPLARRGGDMRGGGALLRFTAEDAGNPCQPPSNADFQERASTTTARAAPSDSAVLWLPNACTTWMRHPTLVRWPPIRRHGLDPQRRKSLIDPRPLGTGFSSYHWLIFLMGTSRPPWRATVYQSASAMACRRTVASGLAAAGSRVIQA